jgi:hypothetical protein
VTDLTSQDLGRVVRVATDKTKRELALPTKQPATVIEYQDSSDSNVPRAMVHFDDAPADHTAMVKVHGGPVASGDRVHVGFDPPHGMTIDNRGSGTVGLELPCNASCGVGPVASVDFHLDAAARVGIIINAEAMGGWSIDGVDVESPTSPFAISTSYTFEAGDHNVSATGTGKDPQCVQILLIVGGSNTGDGACVQFHDLPECLDYSSASGGFAGVSGEIVSADTPAGFELLAGTYPVTIVVTWVNEGGTPPTGSMTVDYDIEPDTITDSGTGDAVTTTLGPTSQNFTTGGTYTWTLNLGGIIGDGTTAGHYEYHITIGTCE